MQNTNVNKLKEFKYTNVNKNILSCIIANYIYVTIVLIIEYIKIYK